MADKPTYEELEKEVAEEISDRKTIEESLRKGEEEYRNLLDTMEEGYYEVDLAGNYTFFNQAVYEYHGRSRDELMGMNYREYMPPETAKKIYTIFNEIYTTGIPARAIDYEVITKDGSTKIVEMSAFLLKDSSGKPIGFHGIARDRTEQKKAEMALRESEEKYRLLVENAHEGIYITQDGVVKFPNPRTEGLTGYSANELASMPFVDLIHPKDKDSVVDQQKRLETEQLSSAYSFRIINRENETLWVESNSILISWEGRQATLNFLRDITPQKKMEAQFIQAQKMEAVGTLAGGIAHDFNNLLMGIQGNASLLLLDIESDHPHYEKLRRIKQLVERGAGLTKQLLGAARGGKYDVRPSNPNKLVGMSSDLFARTRKEISIHKELQEGVWTVEVDRSQMEQVLLNLYVNASHAMPEGGDLYLETKNITLDEYDARPYGVVPGRFVRISITDTGIGMDESIRKRVFDLFFTTKAMGGGTGLGLASAYGIVKNHGGIINVYSEEGEGTTFKIYLPESEKETMEEADCSEKILRGTETILLIDDEDVIIEIGHELLLRLGYRVITAQSGEEAIEIYRKERDHIDLVILDMIMPGMSGGDTYDKLTEIDPPAKVILSSGYSMNGQAQTILDRGCKGFIQKPFSVGDLSKKLRRVLDESE